MNSTILIFNIQSTEPNAPAWEDFPEDVWKLLLEGFFAKLCNGFGLRWVQRANDLGKFKCFADWQPNQIGVIQHDPETVPDDENPETYREPVAVFELNRKAINRILTVPFGEWAISNDEFPTDELVFVKSNDELAMAVPYEDFIWFYGLTPDEFQMLASLDSRIADNLRSGRSVEIY